MTKIAEASGYDKLAELREKASPGPYTPQRIIGTPEDVHRRQATENLKALSPVLAEVIGELRASLEKIKTYGGVCENFELCHHRGCNDSYSAWAIADAALADTDKKLQEALN